MPNRYHARGLFGSFLVALLLGPLVAPAEAQDDFPLLREPAARDVPRNVVFILSDDHRYDFMGFHPGAPDWLETPAMDRMAREGAHIANAFVTTALCSPSRASILTGQYAHKHGVVDNQSPVPEGTTFFPEHLQDEGYQTAFFGKWHMGDANDNPRPGFDRWVSFRGQGPYYDPTLNIDGERIEHEGYTADLLTDYAVEWLEDQAGAEAPFFLYLSHKNVHADFEPAARHEGIYEDVDFEYPETMANTEENYAGRPDWVREQRNSWHGVDYMYHGRRDFDSFVTDYSETLLSLDESIGRVLETLERAGLADETLVIYMGDNGFSFGEHGLIDKRHAYEESMRVPMLAWAPGFVEPGRTIDEVVVNIDVAPTMLDLAGHPVPEAMDGSSFLPILAGEAVENWRGEVLYEYYWEWNFPQTPTTFALRDDRYKYIFYHGVWDTDELYDLHADPIEKDNLALDPDYQDLRRQMRERLFDQLEATDGMQIPLRRPTGNQQADRDPAKMQ